LFIGISQIAKQRFTKLSSQLQNRIL